MVRTLANERDLAAGRHAFTWDGRDAAGIPVRAGMYYARLRAGAARAVAAIVLLR